MKKNGLLILIAALLCLATLQTYAALTAKLDRSQIIEGEAVQLTIEATGRVSAMPDTKVLEKDFEVMGVMSGSRVNIINGKVDSSTTWTLSLSPKRSGELTIPPITIDGEQTPSLSLLVKDYSADSGIDNELPIFIETAVDKNDPYVQGMVRYTMRIFLSVNLSQGSLSEPELDNALVHRLGEDREYQTTHDGKPYHVIEREFVIFPQTSGDLLIPAPVLDAQIPENTSRRDPFFDRIFTNSRPIRLRGDAITLHVQPRPAQSKSPYWLPAESVQLTEEWQPKDASIAIGNPLSRQITIQATGVTGEQLPDLQFEDSEGFKLYPDRSQSNTQHLPQTIAGEKTIRLAYMPTQPGKYTLPAFELHWWDTQANQERIATLPERTVEVIPSSGQSQPAPLQPSTPIMPQPDEQITTSEPQQHTDRLTSDVATSSSNHTGWFWASLLFASLWLVTLGLWWRNKNQNPAQHVNKAQASESPQVMGANKARKQFLAACKTNKPQQARHLLLQWAAIHWPESPPQGLGALASRLNDPAIKYELTELDSILYQRTSQAWNGQELAKLLTKLPAEKQDTASKNSLPGLYSE